MLGRICAAIAGDEARHEKAYIKIVDALFERCGHGRLYLCGLLLCHVQGLAADVLKKWLLRTTV